MAGGLEIVSIGMMVVGVILAAMNGSDWISITTGSSITGSISEAKRLVSSSPEGSKFFFSDGYVDQAAEVSGNLKVETGLAQNRFVDHIKHCVVAPVRQAKGSSKIYAWASACGVEPLFADTCSGEGLCGTLQDTNGRFSVGPCAGIDLNELIAQYEQRLSKKEVSDLGDLKALPVFDFADPYKRLPRLKQLTLGGVVLALCGFLLFSFYSECACFGKRASAKEPEMQEGACDFQAFDKDGGD